jgi:hypothetical protein
MQQGIDVVRVQRIGGQRQHLPRAPGAGRVRVGVAGAVRRLTYALLLTALNAHAQPPAGAWTPPNKNDGVAMDSSKLPDITGIRLGMPMAEASAVVQKLNPGRPMDQLHDGPNANQSFVDTLRVADSRVITDTYVHLTLPPQPQRVWHVSRTLQQPNVARATVIAALRQKYGKEAWDLRGTLVPAANDDEIDSMWWVFDEQGRPIGDTQLQQARPNGCGGGFGPAGGYYMQVARNLEHGPTGWCATHFVGLKAMITTRPILPYVVLEMDDEALLMRSAAATGAWVRGESTRAQQDATDKANQVKPQL